MKISGFSMARNADKLYYPIRQADEVIQTAFIGDVIMTTPLFAEIINGFIRQRATVPA